MKKSILVLTLLAAPLAFAARTEAVTLDDEAPSSSDINYNPNSNDRFNNLDPRTNSQSTPAAMGSEDSQMAPDITSNRYQNPSVSNQQPMVSTPRMEDRSRMSGSSSMSGATTSGATAQEMNRNQQDVELVRKIRSEITSNKDLSMSAHNVQITSQNGQILLRGPVANANEKMKVERIAKRVAGGNNVVDQTTIDTRSGSSTHKK